MTAENLETNDVQAIEKLKEARNNILEQIRKIIIGQQQVIDELLISLLSNGHCIIVGVPGLAKTMLISTIAKALDLSFKRIQFTPDLMPSDITGTEIVEEDRTTGKRIFRFVKGPVFANIVLADEINRTPPKTQAALLQAMQEREVSAGGQTFALEKPFFVLATQNPIEQEGTYPLPEAQLDRFMFNIFIDYPSEDEEIRIVETTTSTYEADIKSVLTAEEIIDLQKLIRRVPVSEHILQFAVRLARSTRPTTNDAPQFIKNWVNWGAGPRASQYLILGAKTRAVLDGRPEPNINDVRSVATPVLRHRIVTNFNAEAEGIDSVYIINKLLEEISEKQ